MEILKGLNKAFFFYLANAFANPSTVDTSAYNPVSYF